MAKINGFCDVPKIAKSVERFAKAVIGRMKRMPQLGPDLRYHLLEIKDIKAPIKEIYLEELSDRLEQAKAPLEKIEKTACEILNEENLPKKEVELILRKLLSNRNDKTKESLRQEIIDYYSQSKK